MTREQFLARTSEENMEELIAFLHLAAGHSVDRNDWDPPAEPTKESTLNGGEPTAADWQQHANDCYDYASEIDDVLVIAEANAITIAKSAESVLRNLGL